jgi:putative oxidoreductase
MRLLATWVLSLILALAFLGAAFAKFTAQPSMVTLFQSFNYPLWFMYVTGVLELAGAVFVLIPRFAVVGAGLLSAIMVGAIVSHLTHGQTGVIVVPLVLLALSMLVGRLRSRSGSKAVRPATAA